MVSVRLSLEAANLDLLNIPTSKFSKDYTGVHLKLFVAC